MYISTYSIHAWQTTCIDVASRDVGDCSRVRWTTRRSRRAGRRRCVWWTRRRPAWPRRWRTPSGGRTAVW
ncbi:unnamed protein product [Musa acuminata subsp. burmannicoides]